MSGRRVVAALLATMLGAAVISVLPGSMRASAAPADGASPDSAVTVSGQGEFKDLKVRVSQTKNLINQNVRISWTGGAPTVLAGSGGVAANFLQIMQCWGDDPAGPDRTQCQFGANKSGVPAACCGLVSVRSRQTVLADPEEKLSAGAGQVVPFWPAGLQQPTALVNSEDNAFFDGQITNEIPIAITQGDGTGQADFEIQTLVQSAGLGCGEPVEVNGTTAGRSCWLVIVPRGTKEWDGSTPLNGLTTGPLEPENWAHKIAVRLDFVPQGQPCPPGAPQLPLTGHEFVVEAVSRWQPALCANGDAQYPLTQLNDDAVRSNLRGTGDPGLALVSNPVPPDQQRSGHPLVYAPVAVSGLVFAFDIVANPPNLGVFPNDPRQSLLGQQFTEMNLTPRLVAKLLTQSYRGDIAGYGAAVPEGTGIPAQPARLQSNPMGLTNDPEFLKFNTNFQLDPKVGFSDPELLASNLHVDALVQGGTSDLTQELWDWVLADQEARDFIDGKPDPWGMVVNDANKSLQPPVSTYPRNDQSCQPVVVTVPSTNALKTAPYCTGDEHIFANDMHTAARAASRGDTLGLDKGNPSVDNNGNVTWGKKPRQDVTQRALIAVVDAATAIRYALPTAKLRNAAGQFVAPDAAGLQAGLNAMKPSPVPGVLQPDPATNNPAAYPLTSVSNAVTSPPALTKDEGREYATFLRYAVGPGQQPGTGPGQLPFGYLPLPEPMRQQALAAATTIETQAGQSAGPVGSPPAPPGAKSPGVPASDLSGSVGPNTTLPGGTSSNAAPIPARSGVTSPGAAPTPAPAQNPVTRVLRTPSLAAPAVSALLLTILICGALAATSSPVLQSPVIHRLSAAIRRLLRKGVGPTEQ